MEVDPLNPRQYEVYDSQSRHQKNLNYIEFMARLGETSRGKTFNYANYSPSRQNNSYDYDIDTEVVWVEGITDYNYLTMFKNLLEIKNIAFLPFNGVRSNDADQIKLIQNLSSIKLYKFSILVDGDKAGLAMVRNCKNTKFEKRIHNLS